MSFERIQNTSLLEIARQRISWEEALQYPEIASLFGRPGKTAALHRGTTPSRLSGQDRRHRKLCQKVMLTDQACRMLRSLNDYDREKVSEEILSLSENPNAPDLSHHRHHGFMRLKKQRYPFKGYHYLIRFSVLENGILVDDIFYDFELMAPQPVAAMERNALYRIDRKSDARFEAKPDRGIQEALATAWETEKQRPVHRIETRHAAVNGMQNDLVKASWLMGTHVDVAYRADAPKEYTLFHNPSEGGGEDFYECTTDKRFLNPSVRFGRNSYSANVSHLAAVLRETQQRGHSTHWVAHSQGAIIFARAVGLHNSIYGGSLNCHKISLHGAGCSISNAKMVCTQAGIEVLAVRNNPFDMVPNIAGGNDLSRSGLARSIKFRKLVLGDDSLASPHTLPYLGLETYHHQLLVTGNHDYARHVKRYIAKVEST